MFEIGFDTITLSFNHYSDQLGKLIVIICHGKLFPDCGMKINLLPQYRTREWSSTRELRRKSG